MRNNEKPMKVAAWETKHESSLLLFFLCKTYKKTQPLSEEAGDPRSTCEPQSSAFCSAGSASSPRGEEWWKARTHGATNCLSCPHNIILNDPEDADCGNYFPIFWGDAIEIFSRWHGSPGIEFYLLIPQHKVHAERSEAKVMMGHHFRMKTQSPLTSFGVWPLTPWHHKTNPVYARALPLNTRSL